MSNYIYENHNSKSFYSMAWIALVVSFVGMGIGILYMGGDIATTGFLVMAYLFSVTSCFTVAKVVRDKHEADQFLNKVEKTKTEKYMSEHTPILPGIETY